MKCCLLAFDIGGTKISAAILEWPTETVQTLTFQKLERVYSPPDADAKSDLRTILGLSHTILTTHKPLAIGVSFGGPVDWTTNTVRLSHHIPGWEDIHLGDILEAELGVPVSVDNDANVAALGEYRFGAAKGSSSMMYITISTGVGGGFVLDNKIWHGADGMAGEIGHMVVDPSGPLCLCGKKGCVERMASGPYMAEDARRTLELDSRQGLIIRKIISGHLDKINGQVISQASSQGDELATELMFRSAWALGVGIGNVVNLVNPQLIVLGGGVTKSGQNWWRIIRETARQVALPQISVQIVPAALGDDSPLWGALALAETAISS
jgi:glucokinase